MVDPRDHDILPGGLKVDEIVKYCIISVVVGLIVLLVANLRC
jgi:hypothetical protein